MAFFHKAVVLISLANILSAYPVENEDSYEPADDMETVGSYIRVVRAAKNPTSYHISHDDSGDGEIGYSRKKSDGGKRGYQHFDSYRKKEGDAYEFEKHDTFDSDDKGDKDGGHSDGGHSDGHSEKLTDGKKKKAEKYTEGDGSYESDGGDGDDGTYTTSAGEADSYGGPSGYDEEDSANYNLPNKYEYGEGDDYNY